MQKKKGFFKKALTGSVTTITLVFLSTSGAQQKKPEVPFVPTPDEVVLEMLTIAHVAEDDILYDLGCGDGRIVITAAKKFGCRGVGIDINPERIKESRENAAKADVSGKVEFIQMDLFEANISEATVVTLYLLSKVNLELLPKLFRELSPGTRVVSHQFDMGRWEPDASSSVRTENHKNTDIPYLWDFFAENLRDLHHVYFWVIPANVTGTWKLRIPELTGKTEFTLKLDQEFQRVRGETFEAASPIPLFIKDEKINGILLDFTMEIKHEGRTENMLFEGSVEGHTMSGTLKREDRPGEKKVKWIARREVSTIRSIIVPESSEKDFLKSPLTCEMDPRIARIPGTRRDRTLFPICVITETEM